MIFYIVETSDKLLVGFLQRIIRIELIETGCIDHREEEIAELLGRVFLIALGKFSLEFFQFFVYLVPYILLLLPVEAHVSCLVLNAICLDKGWEGIWHTAQNALVTIFLLLLDLLPGFLYRGSILGFGGTQSQGFFRIGSFCLPGFHFFRLLIYHLSLIIDIHIRIRYSPFALFLPVDERMAEHQLICFLIADITDIELAVFSADNAIEHHVLQHIAQLLLDILVFALHQGITKLESLLDGIRTKTLECLLLIPWTLQAQTVLHIQQAAERR